MEARELLQMDGRRYRNLRLQASREAGSSHTSDLQRELEVMQDPGADVIGMYHARGTRLWGVNDDLALAGVLGVSPIYLAKATTFVWLWGLHILPRYRGTAASRLLMETALAWRDRHHSGLRVLGSFHRENRRARQMVERFGFQPALQEALVDAAGLQLSDHVLVECKRPVSELVSRYA